MNIVIIFMLMIMFMGFGIFVSFRLPTPTLSFSSSLVFSTALSCYSAVFTLFANFCFRFFLLVHIQCTVFLLFSFSDSL